MPDVTSPQTAPKPVKPDPVTWGPGAAFAVTAAIYFLSQFLGGIVIVLIGRGKGLSQAELTTWVEHVGPQFFYVSLVEGTTLGALALFLHTRKASFKTLGLTKPQWSDLAYALTGFALYFPVLIGVMAAVQTWLPQVNIEQKQQIGFQGAHGWTLAVAFISLVVLPPVAEEIVARGFLFLGLRKRLPVIWAALITSLLFASVHLQAGSGAPLLWTAAVDTFILSLVLVWLRQKTGRLWASIGLHMLKNGIAFMALFIFIT